MNCLLYTHRCTRFSVYDYPFFIIWRFTVHSVLASLQLWAILYICCSVICSSETFFIHYIYISPLPHKLGLIWCHVVITGTPTKLPSTKRPSTKRPATKCPSTKRPRLQNVLPTKCPRLQNVLAYKTSYPITGLAAPDIMF